MPTGLDPTQTQGPTQSQEPVGKSRAPRAGPNPKMSSRQLSPASFQTQKPASRRARQDGSGCRARKRRGVGRASPPGPHKGDIRAPRGFRASGPAAARAGAAGTRTLVGWGRVGWGQTRREVGSGTHTPRSGTRTLEVGTTHAGGVGNTHAGGQGDTYTPGVGDAHVGGRERARRGGAGWSRACAGGGSRPSSE